MKRNQSSSFIGLEELKEKHAEQYQKFVSWAEEEDWSKFHHNHYDWWMFPIDRESSHGKKYTVYSGDVQELKRDEEFIENYLHGIELLALAWGWYLKEGSLVGNPDQNQCWQNWPIRLKKAIKSLLLFGFEEEAESLLLYADILIKNGKDMTYKGRNLATCFTRELKGLEREE